MEGTFYICILNFIFILTCIGYLRVSEAYNAIYDLNEMCETEPLNQVSVSPSHPATFVLNATYSNTTSIFTPSWKKRDNRHFFSCVFSVKPKQYGSNVSLDIEWKNLGTDCHDVVQIMKTDEKSVIDLEKSGKRFLTISGGNTFSIFVSICKMPSADHFLQIIVSASSPKPDKAADISSIVLAFMAPFAFILLAVILAVMGSCCCSRRYNQNPLPSTADLGTSCPPSETGLTSSLSQPSGSRDTLFTVTSVVDKPPSYDDLFPCGFIYDESALNKLHKLNVPNGDANATPQHTVITSDVTSQIIQENNDTALTNPNEMIVVV